MKIAWTELIKFLKSNVSKIVIGSIITSIVFGGLSFVFGSTTINDLNNKFETLEIDSEAINPEARQANFKFYIEDNENDVFINNLLIGEYFTTPEILEDASNETNTNLKEIVKETDNEAIIANNQSAPEQIIGVNRNGSTHIHTFYVNIGSESDNLRIANYYYDYLTENNIPFLDDKTIYVFQEPEILELDEEEENVRETTNNHSVIYDVILSLIVGALFGIIAVILVLFVLTLFSKKLIYSFSYSTLEEDYFFLIDSQIEYSKENLEELLSLPPNARKVIINENDNVIQNSEFNDIKTNLDNTENIEVVNNILEIEAPEEMDRIIYIIKENITSRKWYNNQRKLSKNLGVPVVIIQVNAV